MTPGKVGRSILGTLVLGACFVMPASAEPAGPVSITLTWTAPGDDGWKGRAVLYDLRYSNSPIDEFTFEKTLRLATVPVPSKSGSQQTLDVHGLDPNYDHYFAIKTRDDSGNWSRISNTVHVPIGFKASKGPPSKLIFLPPSPNPARNETHFTFELPVAERVEIDAYDMLGRRVCSVASGVFAAGVAELTWNLSDDAGRRVPSGVYLLRGQFGAKVITRRVAVVR